MFKNWKAICECPDPHFRWALSFLDLETDLGKKIVKQFPEYFMKKSRQSVFKNWKTIRECPDPHFRYALALLDITSCALGKKMVQQFPEYFTEEEVQGPIPLSVLRIQSDKECGGVHGRDQLVTNKVIPEWMPVLHFDDRRSAPSDLKAPCTIPSGLQHLREVGQVAGYGGKKVVLVEYKVSNLHGDHGNRDWWFVPKEYIDVDR